MASLRIAVGGIHTESSTCSPVLMEPEDFRVLRGKGLLEDGYFGFLSAADGVDLEPLLHARAVPGGPVSRETYRELKAEFLARLEAALPLDGLYLAMHGAMNVEGIDDAEGDWIAAARALLGEDCPIAASYDLHGNVGTRVVDALDIFAAYRTAPHIDTRQTMARAWDMLVAALRSGRVPGIAWAPVPLLLPGECTSTEDEPAKGLYANLPRFDARPGIADANLVIGYVWADEPRATAAAVVTAPTLCRALLARDWQAVVRIGGVTVVLAARRRPYHAIADFRGLGLDPAAVGLLVVKSGYLSPELAPIANPNLMALTDGVVNQDIPRLGNARRRDPTFPFRRDFAYRPEPRLSARWARRTN